MATVTSLNAVDFGLTSGSTNQTTNLQAAINAAQTQQLPLFIPDGSYPITTVNITAPVEIYSTNLAAQIVGFGQSPCFNIGSTTPGTKIGPVAIRGLHIYGANQAFSGSSDPALIQAIDVESLTISNCLLRDSGRHGIRLSKCHAQILGNEITGSHDIGIYNIDSSKAVLVDKNTITFSGNIGVYFRRAVAEGDQGVISNNQIGFTTANDGGTGANGNAIFVDGCHYVSVIDNMTWISTFSAVRYSNSNNAVITGNRCYDSKENAIYIEAPGEEVTWYGGIIANNIVDLCGGGIAVGNSNFGGHWISVTGNQVSRCVLTEIPGYGTVWGNGISVEADGLVGNNQVDGADGWGIVVYAANNGSIGNQKVISQVENNMIKNCAGGVAFYKDDTTYGRVLIGGNTVCNYTTTAKFAALVPASYNGATGEVSKLSGATDLGNATTSGFANVILLRNYSFN